MTMKEIVGAFGHSRKSIPDVRLGSWTVDVSYCGNITMELARRGSVCAGPAEWYKALAVMFLQRLIRTQAL